MSEQYCTNNDVLAITSDLNSLVERARSGDSGALPELRRKLKSHPEIWMKLGNLAAHAQHSWIELCSGNDHAMAESLRLRLAAMRAELAGASPSPLERLLAERVVACWLQLHQADAAAAQCQTVSVKQGEFLLKRQHSASRRYLQAIAALATVQKLLPKAIDQPTPPAIEVSGRVRFRQDASSHPGTDTTIAGPDDDARSASGQTILPLSCYGERPPSVSQSEPALIQGNSKHEHGDSPPPTEE